MPVSALFLCRVAGDLAKTHGLLAVDVARQAAQDRDAAGDDARAAYWHLLSILVEDVQRYGLDPAGPAIQ